MSGRPNAHTRANRPAAAPVDTVETAFAIGQLADSASARGWLAGIDLSQPEHELYDQLKWPLPALSGNSEMLTIQHWWNDEADEVRLAGALLATRRSGSWGQYGIPDRASLRDLCSDVLHHAPDERTRCIAALSLAAIHAQRHGPSETQELDLLDQALTADETRYPALLGLHVSSPILHREAPFLQQLSQLPALLDGADLRPRDWAMACLIAFRDRRTELPARVVPRLVSFNRLTISRREDGRFLVLCPELDGDPTDRGSPRGLRPPSIFLPACPVVEEGVSPDRIFLVEDHGRVAVAIVVPFTGPLSIREGEGGIDGVAMGTAFGGREEGIDDDQVPPIILALVGQELANGARSEIEEERPDAGWKSGEKCRFKAKEGYYLNYKPRRR